MTAVPEVSTGWPARFSRLSYKGRQSEPAVRTGRPAFPGFRRATSVCGRSHVTREAASGCARRPVARRPKCGHVDTKNVGTEPRRQALFWWWEGRPSELVARVVDGGGPAAPKP